MAETDYEILDEQFRRCIRRSAQVERLYTGCRWAEGPVYFPLHRTLVWSDIPNDRMLRYDEATGTVGTFREPARFVNGNARDREGRLVSCEQGSRCVTRTGHDGRTEVLAERYEGRRFNSPNDVVVKSDGSVWFTDPTYGIDSDYEGHRAEAELDGCHVYRIDPGSGAVRRVCDDFERPNGLAFSPDERRLYVSDTGATHRPDGPRHLRVFDVREDGTLRGGERFATCDAGLFDGFTVDADGRVWASSADGVRCYAPDGALLGKVRVPETVANVTFGGPRNNRLYICATTSLYSVLLPVNGAG